MQTYTTKEVAEILEMSPTDPSRSLTYYSLEKPPVIVRQGGLVWEKKHIKALAIATGKQKQYNSTWI